MADPGRAFFVSGMRGEVTGPADCGLEYPLGVCVLRKKFFLALYFVFDLEATTIYSMICWKMPCFYHEIMIQYRRADGGTRNPVTVTGVTRRGTEKSRDDNRVKERRGNEKSRDSNRSRIK